MPNPITCFGMNTINGNKGIENEFKFCYYLPQISKDEDDK